MIKVLQRVEFNCDHSGVGYDGENLEFCDDAGNHVVIDFRDPGELPRLGLQILQRIIVLATRGETVIVDRDYAKLVVNTANDFLKATEPVES